MHFSIVSLFPDFFVSPLSVSLMGKAQATGLVTFSYHDPRDHADNRHRHVDDRPYGGGPGMVIQAGPMAKCLRTIERPGRILLMSPGGRRFDQKLAVELAQEDRLTIVCGRYEGLDTRISEIFGLEPVCVGDAVLNGGESAALAVIEAVSRLLPGFMGCEESGNDESFSNSLLEYPHYTRPENFEGLPVPEILQSGDHAKIATWRRQQALAATLARRPELLEEAALDGRDAAHLASLPLRRISHNLSFCLVHNPVLLEGKKTGTSSLTNLDIHDIARISRSYGMGPFYVVSPLEDQLELLQSLLRHWLSGPGGKSNPDRANALSLVRAARTLDEAIADFASHAGMQPTVLASSASWPLEKKAVAPLTPLAVRQICRQRPVMICLGTARGLARQALRQCDGLLRPLRYLGYNHLSVRSAAAILADRILGDYC